MSDPRLISPLLDNFIMGGPISDHHGVRCCPAMENETDEKYIVKVISIPSSPTKLDALLLSGAYPDETSALAYFQEIADGVIEEINVLNRLSEMEGFLPYLKYQKESMDSGRGYDIYLLSPYKRTLEKHFKRHNLTHLDVLNLGLDLCSALAVCRRSGYMFIDLKPSNIFVSGERLYRIGDLGFVRLDSLKYTSLPEKYLSVYTPPEISDAFSALNTTMDTYAAGLVLYQAYNGGLLPFNDDVHPGDKLPPPLYADYEMSEIILKACSPDPEARWQDPMQMGQAIVSYMQRNGASDTPIVPPTVSDPEPEITTENCTQTESLVETETVLDENSVDKAEVVTEENTVHEADAVLVKKTVQESENISSFESALGESSIESSAEFPPTPAEDESLDGIEEILSEDSLENQEYSEDEFGNLSFLDDILDSDTELIDESGNYETLSDEVSQILNQADELAGLEVPEPVVAPEYVEVPVPEPIIEDETIDETDVDSDHTQEQITEEAEESSIEEIPPVKKKKNHWLRYCILILLLLALLAGGYYYYQNYYLLPIEAIKLNGTEDSLTVQVKTNIDESLLQVICSDTYGNQIPAPVVNGIAVFSDLVPDTAYSINIVANGFHRLIGNTATAYSTPVQSEIVQFDAVTGTNDGSVILNFTVEGPDCDEWTVQYNADGEKMRSATFSSHTVTITNLTIGKEYTFRLIPEQDLYLTGHTEVVFTACKLVKADNLTINSCNNNTLDVSWTMPEDADVSSWSVRCYNDNYSETLITADTFASFQNIDDKAGYTVEVKAIGMSVGQIVSIPENSVTVSNLQADTSDPTRLSFTWETNREIPALPDGWQFCYTVEGCNTKEAITCVENSAFIAPVVPNATYYIHLEDTNGNMLLGSETTISTGDSIPFYWDFDGYDVHADDLVFNMCRTPDVDNWTRFDLDTEDYTTSFASGEAASFLVQITKRYNASSEQVTTMYVIRNKDGLPLYVNVSSDAWMNMWYQNYCELNIPVMPTVAGEYTIEVFFNGGLVTSQPFTIT